MRREQHDEWWACGAGIRRMEQNMSEHQNDQETLRRIAAFAQRQVESDTSEACLWAQIVHWARMAEQPTDCSNN